MAEVLAAAEGLTRKDLASLWKKIDRAKRGKLTFLETAQFCGIIGQAQRGDKVDVSTVTGLSQAPAVAGVS